ncbi:MAG: hypothetical protein PF495_16700 [Spirochaetales bacterium]|jgi:hypothetical protein|nr:hypothetical protein [Spirochaetales bacterium]
MQIFSSPSDRQMHSIKGIPFSPFQAFWLDPIFETFSNLAIHEAVRDELVSREIKSFIQTKENATPPKIIIHKDSELTRIEQMLRDSIEAKIFPYTHYHPQLNNRDDRGEVKTLAYIAVKGLLYFAAHDHNAIQLVEKAESWSTGLDTVQTIKMYEIMFFLYVRDPSIRKSLRMLYKYQYYLTKKEKSTNPEWGVFIKSMESLYQFHLQVDQ